MIRVLKFLVILSLTLLAFSSSQAQIIPFPSAGSYGIGYHRIAIDSVLYLPTGCGIPSGTASLRSYGFGGQGQKLKMVAIQADTCGHHVYWYSPTDSSWNRLDGSGGGGDDSVLMASKYYVDTAKANIRAQILLKLNISDSNTAYASWGRLYKTIDSMKIVNDAKYLQKANNLSDVANAATSRTNLGLGTAAIKDVAASGNASATQVVKGDDTRLTDSRAPNGSAGGSFLNGTYPNPGIVANSIGNSQASQMGANTIKGNNSGSTANASDLTAAQVAAMLPTFTTSANGLVPQSVTSNTTDYLRRDGSWATPPGTGGTTFANPTGTIGLTAVNGAAITAMRSDAAPPLSQSIVPTWTGVHTFSTLPVLGTLGGYIKGSAGSLSASTTIPTTDLTGTLQVGQEPAHSGDVTNSAGSLALTITNNAVTNAKAAQMGATTIKANVTGSTANATDATPAQINTILPTFTSSLNGLVPFPGGSPTGAKVLADNGTWVTAGGSSLATASGDATGTVSGTNLPLSVVKIQGTPVSSTAPTIGQIQVYDPGTGQYNPTNGGYLIGDTTMKLGNWTFHSGIQPGGKTLNFLGDSWTAGSGASSPTTTSFPAIVSGATGATMGQYGVPGMTLETDGTGNNYQGVPSIIQRLSTIPNNSTSTAGIILEFGLNDLPPVGSYNPTHLASALDTLLRHVIDTAHFTRRDVAVMGMPWIPDATLTYYGTISGGTAPTRARLKQYDSVIQAGCIKWGVSYIPCYYQLKDNMNDSSHYVTTGQLHLDDAGHKFYGYNIIQKLSLQTGSPWSQSGSTIQAVTTPANVNLSTSGTGVATSTPNYMDWGDRYGIVEGPAQLKAIFYNDGTVNNRFGVGVYSGKMLIHAGGASTVMDFWIGGNPYLSLSTSAFTLNGATQNKFQLRNTTSSGATTPDQVNAGGTFFNSGVFDSSKTKLAWYQSSSSAFGGVGINNTNSYFVTPHGFPFALMYDNTSSLIVDKFLTASNYASFGNGLLFDTTNNKLVTINQTTGKINQTYWAGINWGAGGGSGYTTIQNNTSSVTARAKINLPSGSGLTVTDNSGNTSSDLTITSIPSAATGTTQAAHDSSAKVSTTQYIDKLIGTGVYLPSISGAGGIVSAMTVDSAKWTRVNGYISLRITGTVTFSSTGSNAHMTWSLPAQAGGSNPTYVGTIVIGGFSTVLGTSGVVSIAAGPPNLADVLIDPNFSGSAQPYLIRIDYNAW